MPYPDDLLVWGTDQLSLAFSASTGRPVAVSGIGPAAELRSDVPSRPATRQSAVEILLAGTGRDDTGSRSIDTTVGNRLHYLAHRTGREGAWSTLVVDQHDPVSGLTVHLHLRMHDGEPAIRAVTRVVNGGSARLVLEAVTSLCVGGLLSRAEIGSGEALVSSSEWLAEGRWRRVPLRPDAFPDISFGTHGHESRGRLSRSSRGGWSSGVSAPVAGVLAAQPGRAWLWQIEHSGSWEWELFEESAGLGLALSGPRDDAHGWSVTLEPGESFETVPVAVVFAGNGLDTAVAALTRYRRQIRRPHPDTEALPLVFNDYMNTLNGDPTSRRLTPLIDAAADLGAEIFCIDAGWYDDSGDWWDSVGEWRPSTRRFEHGLEAILDHIKRRGMVAGLWLEPEVVGVRSPVADSLPPEAFFRRHDQPVRQHGRLHLDLRHPAARSHLDAVVDRLVGDAGVGYLKLDYNIDPGVGTDVGGQSAGAGLLGHHRAYYEWLDGVLARYPDLVLENCASGGMRADYGLLSRLQLQSTSDQQDPVRYPPIAVAAPMWVLPEQAANWAYPQREMPLEEVAVTLATGLTGRFYLSGHLNRLDDQRRRLVREAVATWQETRTWLTTAEPIWPLGLPGWDNTWLVAGLRRGTVTRLVLTRRFDAATTIRVPLPHLAHCPVDAVPVFPLSLPPWDARWDPDTAVLEVSAAGSGAAARILDLTALPQASGQSGGSSAAVESNVRSQDSDVLTCTKAVDWARI